MERAKRFAIRRLRASLNEEKNELRFSAQEREVHGRLEEELRELVRLEAEMRTLLPANPALGRFQNELVESRRFLNSWKLGDASRHTERAWKQAERLRGAIPMGGRLRGIGDLLKESCSALTAELSRFPVVRSAQRNHEAAQVHFHNGRFDEASAILDVVEATCTSWSVCDADLLASVYEGLTDWVGQGGENAGLASSLERLVEYGYVGLARQLLDEMRIGRPRQVSERQQFSPSHRLVELAIRTERLNQTLSDWTITRGCEE